jgi:hypothetical protein
MKNAASRTLAVAAVCFSIAACTGGPRPADEPDTDTQAGGELASAATARDQSGGEGAGEHARAESGEEHGEGREGGGEHARAERGEHEGEGGEHGGEGAHGEEGEESGEMIGREDTWDKTRRGGRLVLAFDPAANAFVGTVENTTEQRLCAVRVEVHLSTGTELGPTERTNLPSGETTAVTLPTEGETFDQWTAHPETSRCPGA